jgi:hypothetical protein
MTPAIAIRLAMMGGVLLFGGVSWFLHQTPDWTPVAPAMAAQFSVIGRVVWIVVSIAFGFLFLRFRDIPDPAQASTVAILAWTLGETLALFGGVVFFLTAAAGWYIAGVIALTLAFVAFPGPVKR